MNHGLAPAVEAMLRDDLGLESAVANGGCDVDILPPLSASDVLPNGVNDMCGKACAGPLGVRLVT
eukprot:4490694-Lingulodinium_polyedra.AAC.1